MGDTGSLLIGTVCSILAIDFIETNQSIPQDSPFFISGAPAMALAVLILPIYDTVSSFSRRILQGKSPFSPDKKHIHHLLLRQGLSHTQTTLSLIGVNLVFVLVMYSVRSWGTKLMMLLEIGMALLLGFSLHLLDNKSGSDETPANLIQD